MVVGSGKVVMTEKNQKPSQYFVVELDKWGGSYIYKGKVYTDVNKARKIRDVKNQESLLEETNSKFVIGSIQPFL